MISIKQMKAKGIPDGKGGFVTFPKEFLDTLPEECSCGTDLEIAETLCQVSCPNPRCITKVTQRAVDMLNYIGVLGMGASKCRTFFTATKLYNPYALFAWTMEADYDKTFAEHFSREFMQGIYDQLATKREYVLSEFVKIGQLPHIQDSANELFKDYSDLITFYRDLDAEGTKLIAKLLALSEDSITVMNVYNTLLTYRTDLLAGVKCVKIKTVGKTLNVCISQGAGAPYKTKTDFMNQVKSEFGDKLQVNWLNSVSKTGCDYVICADPNNKTTKVKAADKHGIPTMTGADFVAKLRGELGM